MSETLPEERRIAEEERRSEQALGHLFFQFIKSPKAAMGGIVALAMTVGGTGSWAFLNPGEAVVKELRGLRSDITQIKVTSYAILQTLPDSQRKQAQKIIDIQLAAIEMAKRKRDSDEPQP